MLRILALCQDSYLRDPGIVRDRAAFLLAKLLTRPDMPLALQKFLVWATDALGGQSEVLGTGEDVHRTRYRARTRGDI